MKRRLHEELRDQIIEAMTGSAVYSEEEAAKVLKIYVGNEVAAALAAIVAYQDEHYDKKAKD